MSVKYFNKNSQSWEKIASIMATSINIVDVEGNYESDNIEGALREISNTMDTKVDNIEFTQDNLLNFYANNVLVKSIEIDFDSSVDTSEFEELRNTKFDDVLTETRDGFTFIKLFANNTLVKTIEIKTSGDNVIHVGAEQPTADNCEVWVDTSDDEEFTGKIQDILLDELKSVISTLQNEIHKLKGIIVEHEARIEYLELNGGGSGGECLRSPSQVFFIGNLPAMYSATSFLAPALSSTQ